MLSGAKSSIAFEKLGMEDQNYFFPNSSSDYLRNA
jgi:hypothetical protein